MAASGLVYGPSGLFLKYWISQDWLCHLKKKKKRKNWLCQCHQHQAARRLGFLASDMTMRK
jgi:hypothetical protein